MPLSCRASPPATSTGVELERGDSRMAAVIRSSRARLSDYDIYYDG